MSRSAALALVALMICGTLPAVALPPEPSGFPWSNPTAAGDVTVVAEPLLSSTLSPPGQTTLFAQKGAVYQERVVRVGLTSPGQTATKVEFLYYVEGPASKAPCDTTWVSVCYDKGAVDWIPVMSRAPGWDAWVSNTAVLSTATPPTHILRFTAQPGGGLQQGRPQDFTIAFNVTGSATAGTKLPIQVLAYYDPNPLVWRTTGSGTGGGCYDMGTPSDTYYCRSLQLVIDSAKPTITEMVTRDDDYDGRLDRLEVLFNPNLPTGVTGVTQFMPTDTIDTRRLNVTGGSGAWPYSSYNITNWYWDSSSFNTRLNLVLQEQPYFDTGNLLNVLYDDCIDRTKCPDYWWTPRIQDTAGLEMAARTSGTPALDGANPVLVGASAVEGGETLTLFFSEKVRKRSATATDVTMSELMYYDTASAVPTPTESVPSVVDGLGKFDQMTGNTNNNGDGLDSSFTLRLAINPIAPPGVRYKFGAGDVNQIGGDLIGPKVTDNAGGEPTCLARDRFAFGTGTGTSGNCRNPRNSQIMDVAGLRLFFPETDAQMGWTDPFLDETPNYFGRHEFATPGGTFGPEYRRVTAPAVARAFVDISHRLLTIRFTNPVQSALTGSAPSLSDFDIRAATTDPVFGPGPGGVQSGFFNYLGANQPGGPISDTVVLTMDRAARPTDVDETPSFLKIHCGALRGAGSNGVIDCTNPDAGSRTENPGGGVQPSVTNDVEFLDRTAPRILVAKTVDADHNGFLDGLEITFTEPIRDATFCGDSQFTQGPGFCGGPSAACATGGFPQCPIFDDPVSPFNPTNPAFVECQGSTGASDTSSFRWETGTTVDDNKGIIQAITAEPQAGGLYLIKARDCAARFFGVTPPGGTGLLTGYVMHFATRNVGMFQDRALDDDGVNGNYLPKYCHTPGASGPPANCRHTARVQDGAPPVVMAARTYDAPIYTYKGTSVGETLFQPDVLLNRRDYAVHGDGFLDGYHLTMSEPVNDTSFQAVDWNVVGHTIQGGYSDVDTCVSGCDTARGWEWGNRTLQPLMRHDRYIVLRFNESTEGDTGLRPELTFNQRGTPGGEQTSLLANPGSMVDCVKPRLSKHVTCAAVLANPMATFDTFAVAEQDDAAPQIVRIEGFVGDTQLGVVFSEPVDDGGTNKLARDDFQYGNGDAKPNSGMASGENVRHNPGESIAYVGLNDPLTSSDLGADTLQAAPNAIVEVAPSVTVKKVVPDYKHVLGFAADAEPPGIVSDLRVVNELTTGNSVTLTWTAPEEFVDARHLVAGYLASYDIKYNASAMDADRFETVVNNETVEFLFAPGDLPVGECARIELADPSAPDCDPLTDEIAPSGAAQAVTLRGLKPDRVYHFALRAVDGGTNRGPVSNDVVARTLNDPSPPHACGGTLDEIGPITSTQLKPDGRTNVARLEFNWTAACDEESLVQYRYALNQDANYVVLPSDLIAVTNGLAFDTPEDGNYILHVAAFSGGGQTKTARFGFTVGPVSIGPDEIRALNDDITVTVIRQDGLNNVTWDLPTDLPGVLEAIEIWRKDESGAPVLIATLRGDAADLANGYFLDETVMVDPVTGEVTYQATARSQYRVNMVFATQQKQEEATLLQDKFTSVRGYEGPYPVWLWIVVGVAGALAAAGVIIYVLLGRRHKQVATGNVPYAWESADPNALPVDPATGLPVNPVKCPTCSTTFQAIGMTPLSITCPNCGTSGTLE